MTLSNWPCKSREIRPFCVWLKTLSEVHDSSRVSCRWGRRDDLADSICFIGGTRSSSKFSRKASTVIMQRELQLQRYRAHNHKTASTNMPDTGKNQLFSTTEHLCINNTNKTNNEEAAANKEMKYGGPSQQSHLSCRHRDLRCDESAAGGWPGLDTSALQQKTLWTQCSCFNGFL